MLVIHNFTVGLSFATFSSDGCYCLEPFIKCKRQCLLSLLFVTTTSSILFLYSIYFHFPFYLVLVYFTCIQYFSCITCTLVTCNILMHNFISILFLFAQFYCFIVLCLIYSCVALLKGTGTQDCLYHNYTVVNGAYDNKTFGS